MMVVSIASYKRAVGAKYPRLAVIELHVLELRQVITLCKARALRAALFDNRKSLHLLVTLEAGLV